MKNIITMRCCGNCGWSITPLDEENIMEEQHYEEDDPTRPRAGDCCIGMEHNGNFVCKNHIYNEAGIENYAFYDDKYLGAGYFIVTEYYQHIIKYLKLYRTGSYGNYSYGIRVYEISPIVEDGIQEISFSFNKYDDEMLHATFMIFGIALNNHTLCGKNKKSFVKVDAQHDTVELRFNQTVGKQDKKDKYIDITIDSTTDYRIYKLIAHLYRNMAVVTANMKNDDASKKVRKLYNK